MKLRTEYPTSTKNLVLNHKDKILLSGSCFSENIGKLLLEHKFESLYNPLGISYNPISLHKTLGFNQNNLGRIKAEFHLHEELFFHFDLHSDFKSTDKEALIEKLQKAIETQEKQLTDCHTIILTYGTAWVYELNDNQAIVNNCHKVKASAFNKRMLSFEEIAHDFGNTKKQLEEYYQQNFNFIFTVSPVRHLKDGFRENQLSKSSLHLAINEIIKQEENCFYFPAFEIMMDDLRDYRFYTDDLLHPNKQAIEYIWEQFSGRFFKEETQKLNHEIKKIMSALSHKAFNPQTKAHQDFLKKTKLQIEMLKKQLNIPFQEELSSLNQQLLSK